MDQNLQQQRWPFRIFGTFVPYFRHLEHDGLVLRTHCFSNAPAVICILSIRIEFCISSSAVPFGTVNVRDMETVRFANFL
jgi:hypothetical protein